MAAINHIDANIIGVINITKIKKPACRRVLIES
jgi:hypothetical protein